MSKSTTTVNIAPSESSNRATVVRAIVNEAHAQARLGDKAKLDDCIRRFDEAVAEYKSALYAVCTVKGCEAI